MSGSVLDAKLEALGFRTITSSTPCTWTGMKCRCVLWGWGGGGLRLGRGCSMALGPQRGECRFGSTSAHGPPLPVVQGRGALPRQKPIRPAHREPIHQVDGGAVLQLLAGEELLELLEARGIPHQPHPGSEGLLQRRNERLTVHITDLQSSSITWSVGPGQLGRGSSPAVDSPGRSAGAC